MWRGGRTQDEESTSSKLKIVPDLVHVRCKEKRVEVQNFLRRTKVILWCDMYMFVSHMVATDMATAL